MQTREGSNWIITGMLSLHPHQQIEETGEAEVIVLDDLNHNTNSISGQLERLSVVPMESTIPPEITIQEWRRSAKVVPLRPRQCGHLHEQTSRYDPVQKQLTFLTFCPVCRIERVVAANDSGGATLHRLPVRRYQQPTRQAA